jgi:hypothetical protein
MAAMAATAAETTATATAGVCPLMTQSGHARSIGAGADGAALLRAALATDLPDGFGLATPQMASFKCAGPSVNA